LNLNTRPSATQPSSDNASSTPHVSTRPIRAGAGESRHRPSLTDSEKAVYTTSRIEPWSTYLSRLLWRNTQAPIHGRNSCPSTNGSNSCSMILPTASNETGALALATTTTPTSSGVRKMPSRLEAEALHTAAGTLPRAIEVNAIADCTVAGRQHRNSTPV